MSSCKGPIGYVRAGTVGRQVMSQMRRCADAQMRRCADALNCAVRYQPRRELFVLTEVCGDIIHLFGTAALAT